MIKLQLKDGVEPGFSSDPYYDIIVGGYFNPRDYLDSEEAIEAVNNAIKLLDAYADLVIEEE